jgi:hypothetical protein
MSDEELVDVYGEACLRAGRSNSGVCINGTAASDWEEMQKLRKILKGRLRLLLLQLAEQPNPRQEGDG